MHQFDLDAAIRVYYASPELRNAEISEIFKGISAATINRKKRRVKEEMRKRGVHTWHPNAINTTLAYEVWGLDIKDLEHRRSKLMELGMYEQNRPRRVQGQRSDKPLCPP